MTGVREEANYRRGVVLGLTMAELMLLLLFVLLLALSLLVERHNEEVARKEAEIKRQKEQLEKDARQISELSQRVDELVRADAREQSYSDVFRELVLVKEERKAAEREVAALEEKVEQARREAAEVKEKAKAYEKVSEAVPGTPRPEKVAEAFEAAERSEQLREAALAAGLPDDPQELTEAIKEAANLRRQMEDVTGEKMQAEERLEFFKRRAGLSNEMPPCWIHPEQNRAEYIFDIVLDSDGLIIFQRDLPHRREDFRALPVESISYRDVLSRQAFARNVRPLYRWSEEEECRFYVRVFDRTAPSQKRRYKQLLGSVEGFFYKYLVQDPNVQPGSI